MQINLSKELLNYDVSTFDTLCALLKLSITLQKVTRMMLILSPRHHATINIDNIELKDDIKYLGVYIDNHLNWQP